MAHPTDKEPTNYNNHDAQETPKCTSIINVDLCYMTSQKKKRLLCLIVIAIMSNV